MIERLSNPMEVAMRFVPSAPRLQSPPLPLVESMEPRRLLSGSSLHVDADDAANHDANDDKGVDVVVEVNHHRGPDAHDAPGHH
jgi:hypothetical protein